MCWSLFLINFRPSGLQLLTSSQVFSGEICKIFKNTFFKKTPPVTASEIMCSGNVSKHGLLTHLKPVFSSYGKNSIELYYKSNEWFLRVSMNGFEWIKTSFHQFFKFL